MLDKGIPSSPEPLPPVRACICCNFFKVVGETYCKWCEDCPTEYCDVPEVIFTRNQIKQERGRNGT